MNADGGRVDGGGVGDSGGGADSGGGGGSLATPVTVTMAAGTSPTTIGASICQTFIGGEVSFTLDPRSTDDCPPLGTAYMSFYLDTGTGEYRVQAGDRIASDGGVLGAVTFESSSEGTVSHSGNPDTRDEVTMLTADTTITVTTVDRTVTFEFSGNDVTVSSFTTH